jgi:hypothetical protein
MKLILLMFLVGMIALVSVVALRRRREKRRSERAKALRAERARARKRAVPLVSANLCGSAAPEPPNRQAAPFQRPPPSRAA